VQVCFVVLSDSDSQAGFEHLELQYSTGTYKYKGVELSEQYAKDFSVAAQLQTVSCQIQTLFFFNASISDLASSSVRCLGEVRCLCEAAVWQALQMRMRNSALPWLGRSGLCQSPGGSYTLLTP